MEKLKQASVPRIFIERAGNRVRVKIFTARPGIVIGKKGQEVENMKAQLAKLTGKEIVVTGIDIVRFENGKAVEHWHEWSGLGLLQQLGLLSAQR